MGIAHVTASTEPGAQRCACLAASANEHAGFQASKLFSPSQKDKPADIAGKWIAAQGDEDALQAVYNTQLAMTYRRNTAQRGQGRRPCGPGGDPRGRLFPTASQSITVGVDTQDYRLEATAIGWGQDGGGLDPSSTRCSMAIRRRIIRFGKSSTPG